MRFWIVVLVAACVRWGWGECARGEEEDREPIVVADFERESDRGLVSSRGRTAISTEISSHGASSLRIEAGELLNLKTSRLGLGRPGDVLKIDVFNGCAVVQPVRVEVFDELSRKGYWWRHVREYAVRPGWNTLRLRVGRLQRGEKNSQRVANSFLDSAKISRVDLAFELAGAPGVLYVDYVRLEPDPPMPEVAGLRAFDFGPENQAVREGFTACSNEVYSEKLGHGWSAAVPKGLLRHYGHPNDLLGDFREARGGRFTVAVPNGTYHMRVYYEDAGWWEDQFALFTWRTITAEKRIVWREDLTPEGAAERFYRFADTEPMPGMNVYETYIRKGRYAPKEFEAEVADGTLDVGFDADRPMACRISALVLWPVEQAEGAAEWCAELDRRLEEEFDAENVYIETSPRGRDIAEIPEAARAGGIVIFSAGGSEPTGPGYVPAKGEVVEALRMTCVPGEDTGVSFSVRSVENGGPLVVSVDETLSPLLTGRERGKGLAATVSRVQNRIQRCGGGYTIVPDILRVADEVMMGAGETRQFWLEVRVSAETEPGRYEGAVTVRFAEGERKVPVVVEVLGIRLMEPGMSFGLFGLLPDVCAPANALPEVVELLRRHGMSSVAGVPLGRAFAEGDSVRVDFREADAVMELLKKAGFRLPVDTYGGSGLSGVNGAAGVLKRPVLEVLGEALDQVEEHAKAAGWLPFSYSMVDEPQWSDEAVGAAADSVAAVHRVAPWLKINGYWSPTPTKEVHQRLMDELDRTTLGEIRPASAGYLISKRKEVGFYGGISRHEFGVKQWSAARREFAAHYAWHGHIRYGDPYYDLDGREPDVCMVYYTAGEVRPSLRLKRVRAGAYDFRYLVTLSDAVKNAKDGPERERGEALLDEAAKAGNLYGGGPAAGSRSADELRRDVAEVIQKLVKEK